MKRVLPFLLLLLGVFSCVTESMAQVPGLPNRWNNVAMADIDTGLVGPATFTVGGKTYVVGGDTSEYYGAHKRRTRHVWVYTHATNSWSKTTPFPGDLRMGAIAFGATSTGKGYYGLGFDTVGYMDTAWRNKYYDAQGMPQFHDTLPFFHMRFLKDFWEYDTATTAWTRLKDFPIADIPAQDTFPQPLIENGIANASGFSIDTVVTINGTTTKNFAGGFIFGESFQIDWDSLKGTATPPGYGDLKWDGSVGIVFSKTPYFYDAALDSFFAGPDMPGIGRSNGAAMILDGEQTIAGKNPRLYAGLGDNDAYNLQLLNIHLKDWYSYDFVTNNWKKERNLPDTGKSNAGTFAYIHMGFVTCGYDGEWRKTFFIYNTEDEDWIRYPDYRDSGRSLGSAFIHGNRGHYGAGFRGNSQELNTFSWYNIDTSTIRLFAGYSPGDTFCAGSDITFRWETAIPFDTATAQYVVQVSDKDGVFEWPMTDNSNMDTFDIKSDSGTITAKLPHKLLRGTQYKIRLISLSPFHISRNTDTFFVKENPKFSYYPKTHPVIDTVCINSDYFIPSKVSGDNEIKGFFEYRWLKNGDTTSQTGDTLFFNPIQLADEGIYRLVAKGDCFADTSVEFNISIENIPAPVINDNLDYPGMVGSELFLCEYDTNTFYVDATGKDISYQWYHNGLPLNSRDNIEGLGGPVIKNLSWYLEDSGVYKLRVYESCGAYTESDSIIVRMRAIPRITLEPVTTDSSYLEGHTINFKIKATGYNLSYQWKKEFANMVDGPRIFGSQTDSLTITQMIIDDIAFYYCVVTGGCPGFSATSNLASMDINANPTILKEPADTLELCVGETNVISIVASGTNLRYRWRYAAAPPNDVLPSSNFFGQDTRLLTIVDAQQVHSGLIVCEVDNSAGALVTSTTCYLRVKPIPGKPIIVEVGNLLQADIFCDKYIWSMNGVWKSQYTTRIIKPEEQGDYTVRVICEDCPSVTSDPLYYLTSIVGVNPEKLDMYPNPTQGKVILDLPGIHAGNPASINIYDLSGKLIKAIDHVSDNSYELDLGILSRGMYIVHVSSQELSFSGKLIKE